MKRIQLIKYLILFAIAIISFHYIYLLWAGSGFKPFSKLVEQLFTYTGNLLFQQGDAIIHTLNINHAEEKNTFYFPYKANNEELQDCLSEPYLEVSPECTSLKQWLHWIFIMLLFPGPIKHKIWYIPAGIIVLHIINVIRIAGLALVLSTIPHYFNFFHDYFFKILFYTGIFGMWAVWAERAKCNRIK